jgi:NAD(P)-dependent dehydrogenase (short-subunit alcohol dehydrogenase family)
VAIWLITGSSRGLGRALAEAVLERGDRLVATARSASDLDDLVARYGDQVRAVALDVTDRAAAAAAVQVAVDAFGGLDVLVNNAGYANVAALEDVEEDDFRAQVETNLWGVVNVTRAALPVLRAQRSGRIIQVGSVGGRVWSAGIGPYQTAKWAVEGFSGVLAQEVGPLGIHVTTVEPGAMATDWAGSSMAVHEASPDYADVIGFRAAGRGAITQGSDPATAAAAIVELAGLDEPPLQLLLGADAYAVAHRVEDARRASDERFRDLTLSAGAGIASAG